MSGVELERIEASIQHSKVFLDTGESLGRLYGNRDFKKVIVEGYFEKEAIRLVHLKSDPAMQSSESQKSILQQMDAIGSLRQYFLLLNRNADLAEKTILADEQTRDELLAEGI